VERDASSLSKLFRRGDRKLGRVSALI
jgi:hypothetical protein